MEKEFKKYNSIENSYREKFIEKIRIQASQLVNTQWSITEKIHGTNVQICLDGEDISLGKRTSVVDDEDTFYNIKTVLTPHFDSVRKLKNAVQEISGEDVERLIVFGELFGGMYLHADVDKVQNAYKVQKGVQYCPHNDVIFFDIYVEYANGNKEYIPPVAFEKYMEFASLPYQKSTVVNSLNEALEYPNDEPSKIYQRFDLPQIDDNIREGVVLKPYRSDVFIGESRVVLKNKNERFAEVSRHTKPDLDKVELPEHLQAIFDEIKGYVNENRLNNVVSHIGEVEPKDIGKIIGLLNKDVLDDYQKDTGKLNTLEKAECKKVTKMINREVGNLVKEVLLPKL